jgi:protein-S-isoprenylcysteine O-methyltransferase Ste14
MRALVINLGSGQMAIGVQQPTEPIDRRRLIVSTTSSLLIVILCLFLPAGTWAWTRGWLFLIVVTAASFLSIMYLRRVNPDVIAGRVNRHKGTKRWDRILLTILLPTLMAIPMLAALDDGRFHWSHLPWWGCVLGYALLMTGMVGLTWAQSVNKFFEPTVRIQTDRGHKVIDTGPYAIIRHPGYAAGYLVFVGMPLALGSLWAALIPAILIVPALVLKTLWEDQTLQDELAGYKEYAQRVRYRLIPGVW